MVETLTDVTAHALGERIVEGMVEVAESIAGGPLNKLHERPRIPGLEAEIKQALTPMCLDLMSILAGPDAYLQGVPNIRVHRPFDANSIVPFHSDVLYGHSPEEVNYWLNLTPAYETNSLWISREEETEALHRALRQDRLSLSEFEELARRCAAPVDAPTPGVHPFCCARIHGSILNETPDTRVSLDLRVLGKGARAVVKRRGGYFRPQWLREVAESCPLAPGTVVTTVASLDEPTPVYLQRIAMERFYQQGPHPELVEFYGLNHAPTLAEAMQRGPVLTYTIRQLTEVPKLTHPIGFVDEHIWITPEQVGLLERLMRELGRIESK
jgi:hypothetical protein